jgi:hypothetical protein
MFVRIFLLVARFLVFLSTHCGQSHALFALRRSIQPAAIASARLPEPEPESNQAVRASPTCEGLSHVSSIVSRPSPIPKIFTPIICKPFSMKGALDTNPAGFHSDNCHKKSLLGLWHKSCAFVHRRRQPIFWKLDWAIVGGESGPRARAKNGFPIFNVPAGRPIPHASSSNGAES